ncbi:MAG TPA: tetratricopeptide repeat protein [Polyangiaceae bacterium]|nr:tetratricopeptide repeat protein [Polyangiaceae bacterium]
MQLRCFAVGMGVLLSSFASAIPGHAQTVPVGDVCSAANRQRARELHDEARASDDQAAIERLRQALDLAGMPQSGFNLGRALERLDRIDDAIAAYDRAAKLDVDRCQLAAEQREDQLDFQARAKDRSKALTASKASQPPSQASQSFRPTTLFWVGAGATVVSGVVTSIFYWQGSQRERDFASARDRYLALPPTTTAEQEAAAYSNLDTERAGVERSDTATKAALIVTGVALAVTVVGLVKGIPAEEGQKRADSSATTRALISF